MCCLSFLYFFFFCKAQLTSCLQKRLFDMGSAGSLFQFPSQYDTLYLSYPIGRETLRNFSFCVYRKREREKKMVRMDQHGSTNVFHKQNLTMTRSKTNSLEKKKKSKGYFCQVTIYIQIMLGKGHQRYRASAEGGQD